MNILSSEPQPEPAPWEQHYALFRTALALHAATSRVAFTEDEALRLYVWQEYWASRHAASAESVDTQ